MEKIIKGMANASEAIDNNFEELSQAKTSHDTRLTTVEQKVVAGQQTVKTTNAQVYVEFMINYPAGHTTGNTTVTASPVTIVGNGLLLYHVTPQATQVRLRFRTFDGSTIPAGTDMTIQYQFVRIDSGD